MMDWEPKRELSPRVSIALTLMATGMRPGEAAKQAGISRKHLQRARASVRGKRLLMEQRDKYVEELRRARVVWRVQKERDLFG